MPTDFFIGVNHPAVGTVSIPITVDADITVILGWLATTYGQVNDVDTNGQPIMRDRSPRELLRCLAEATGHGHAASVKNFMQQQAIAAAVAKVPEVAVTLGEAQQS